MGDNETTEGMLNNYRVGVRGASQWGPISCGPTIPSPEIIADLWQLHLLSPPLPGIKGKKGFSYFETRDKIVLITS